MNGAELFRGAVSLEMTFYIPRPKNHYGTGKNQSIVKNSAPLHVITTPDLTKLIRSTEDALKGIVWSDDRLVVHTNARKFYAQKIPGVTISVTAL